MKNRFGRDTSHLEGPNLGLPAGYATDCLEAVERLLGKEWLEQTKGHRLQTLWARNAFVDRCWSQKIEYSTFPRTET